MASTRQKQRQQQLRAARRAAALQEKKRRERRRELLTVAGVVAAVALVIGGGYLVNSMRDPGETAARSIPSVGSQYGVTVGDTSAPHQVVVYEDFLSATSGEFEKAGHEQLAQLAGQGKVQIEYRPVVLLSKLGPYSARSTVIWGLVLKEDGPDVARKFHDLLFTHQPSEKGPYPSKDDLITLAGKAGADVDTLKTAVEAGDGADFTVDGTKLAQSLQIDAAPTVILDGKPLTDGGAPDDLATHLVKAVQ